MWGVSGKCVSHPQPLKEWAIIYSTASVFPGNSMGAQILSSHKLENVDLTRRCFYLCLSRFIPPFLLGALLLPVSRSHPHLTFSDPVSWSVSCCIWPLYTHVLHMNLIMRRRSNPKLPIEPLWLCSHRGPPHAPPVPWHCPCSSDAMSQLYFRDHPALALCHALPPPPAWDLMSRALPGTRFSAFLKSSEMPPFTAHAYHPYRCLPLCPVDAGLRLYPAHPA